MYIPEILFKIATYLGPSDLCSCVLVCRAWNGTFTSLLYREITELNSKAVGVAQHSVHARILRLPLYDVEIQHLQAGPLTHVQELEVTMNEGDSVTPIWASVLQRNPKLVKLKADLMSYRLLEDIISLCPNLQDLHVLYCDFPTKNSDDCWQWLWKVFQGLTQLCLSLCRIPEYSGQFSEPPLATNLPAMRHLDMKIRTNSVLSQLRIISACKNLEILKWYLEILSPSDIDIDLKVFQTVFRSLDRLEKITFTLWFDFQRPGFGTDWMRELLMVLPPLMEFQDDSGTVVTPGLADGPLSRHFASLVYLTVGEWKGMASEDSHLILTSCPSLQGFSAGRYKVGEIILVPNEIFSDNRSKSRLGPLGWVCTKLRHLFLKYHHETPEKSRLMFDQLCCMENLRSVVLSFVPPGLVPSLIQWDDESLARDWPRASVDVDDYPWMLTTWPKMRNFCTYY